jgi:DNA-binding transcriptional ArsR family regulator
MSKNKNIDIARMGRSAAKAEGLLKQLSHAGRLRILCNLTEGEKTVGELIAICGLSQSAVSQHLAKMREAGLVRARKDGQTVHYRLASEDAKRVLGTLYAIFCET